MPPGKAAGKEFQLVTAERLLRGKATPKNMGKDKVGRDAPLKLRGFGWSH